MELFFEILLAALAVFGLWCLMRLLAERCFVSRYVTLAIEVSDGESEARLAELLEQPRAMLSYQRGKPIAVLYGGVLEEGHIPPRIEELCRRHGAHCYVVNTNEQKEMM